MQTDRMLPQNYVAASVHVEKLSIRSSLLTRLLVGYLDEYWHHGDIIDRAFVVAATLPEELPERVLATIRIVHGENECALPPSYVSPFHECEEFPEAEIEAPSDWNLAASLVSSVFRAFVSDPVVAAVTPIARVLSPRRDNQAILRGFSREDGAVKWHPLVVESNDPFENAVNELIDVLAGAEVPVRKNQLSSFDLVHANTLETDPIESGSWSAEGNRDNIMKVPLLSRVDRGDLKRFFVASGCNHQRAAIRLVESVAWHGMTFPIDPRTCRIELQNGQSFQQGRDMEGNPVFYFRNMCIGPWRKDENAVIAAALHRFESSLNAARQAEPNVRFTVIVLMGRPDRKKIMTTKHAGNKSTQKDQVTAEEGAADVTSTKIAAKESNNPRIDPNENWYLHTSKRMVRRLIHLLMLHYPERLRMALVVLGHGNSAYCRTAVGGALKLAKYIHSTRTREKVKFLVRYADLQDFVERGELVTIAGGHVEIDETAFSCE